MFSLIYHRIKNKKINELIFNQKMTEYDLYRLQKEKLKRLLIHAFKSVPYYTKKYHKFTGMFYNDFSLKNFNLLPIIKREEINKNRNKFISKNLKNNKLIENSTSGSTGEAVYLYYDKFSAGYRRAAVIRNQSWIDVKFSDKKAILWGAPMDLKSIRSFRGQFRSKIKRQLFLSSFNLSKKALNDYAKQLTKFKPKLLISYPGPLCVFSEYLLKNDIKIPSIKNIISSAETLYPWQKDIIQSAFDVPVYNRYGCREFGDIAQECKKREGLHINSDRFFVEVVDEKMNPVIDESYGEILITDLDNYGMPMIRYRIGDVGSIKKNLCSCGLPFPMFKRIEGRTLDIVRAPNGNNLGGTFWTLLLREKRSFKEFQVIQNAFNRIEINFIRSDIFDNDHLNYYREQIKLQCGTSMEVYFNEVKKIPRTISGKTRFVISNLE